MAIWNSANARGIEMPIDEELLKPSREHLARLRGQIAAMEAEMHENIKHYSKEHARKLWREFHLAVEPLRREQEAVLKVITDYYAPPTTIPD